MKKKKNTKRKKSVYTLEITVKDQDGKTVFGHRSEGPTCAYEDRCVEHHFSPASFQNPTQGVNLSKWETKVSVGMNLVRLERQEIRAGERLPFS